MNPVDIAEAADYAAMQSDRWLFIALLIIFLLAMTAVVKWGMTQLEVRDAKIDSLQRELGEVRKEHVTMMLAHTEKFAVIVSANTAALERNTAMNERKLSVLDRIDAGLAKNQLALG